ncbi:hypothetical protein [Sphingomonas prati]|uniref:Uncharacterized protein n=1 Tax=Sphingomonas prati TaxID=1843237 RepID=A0A7W9BR24_9SPHN|nr:hypothetical protein [Sphingomonas prati]MBB5728557.1 hypothetical protein [Sphingomonas prati]GGE72847.1 hypothetical protein GCM10011404_01710 [Sphingomonas prati]
MLHSLTFAFFTVILFASVAGCIAQLMASKTLILSALQLPPAAVSVAPVSAGVARVRVRYVASARRVTPSLRVAA